MTSPCIRTFLLSATATVQLAAMAMSGHLRAEDVPTFEVILLNDAFLPADIKVPVNKAFILKVINKEKVAVEIESKELKIEKVVAAGSHMTARVKPLKAGRYLLVNEYKEATVKGFIVAE